MNLIVFHEFFNFWHFSQEFGHLLEVHIICVGNLPLLGILYHLLCLRIDGVHHEGQVLVSESDPEIILIIKINHSVVSLCLSVFTNFSSVINDVLIVVVMDHRRYDVYAAIYDQECGTWLPWLDPLRALVES